MKNLIYTILILSLYSCTNNDSKFTISKKNKKLSLTQKEAENLAELPLHCIDVEFPNKTQHTYKNDKELTTPKELHPSFYGCYDWHSSVHGHCILIKLMKEYKNLSNKDEIIKKLDNSLSKENILKELEYMKKNPLYERTYGWAWLLKLSEELYSWKDEKGKIWYNNLKPLSDYISILLEGYINKLTYTIRVGTHSNLAFSLSLSYDYAVTTGNKKLENTIIDRSKYFYLKDKNYPYEWEPNGTDFLSPCLSEAELMSKILDYNEYKEWIKNFMPKLLTEETFKPAIISDNTDYQIVHLEGLNLSRGWQLRVIGEKLNSDYLLQLSNEHINASKNSVINSNYGGSHWLATYLIYSIIN